MQNLKDVYMVDYVRTPFSRSRPRSRERSAFSDVSGHQLVGYTLRNMFEKRLINKVKMDEVSEFCVGCSVPIGNNWAYGGRNAWFSGGGPATVPSLFFDRLCGSAMSGLHHGMMSIMTGYGDIEVCSGVEHMFQEPMAADLQKNWKFPGYLVQKKEGNIFYRGDLDLMTGFSMLQTAQKLFEEESDHISVEDMAKFGTRSHNLAEKALNEGYFKDEITPVVGHKEGNIEEEMLVEYDLSIRKGATLEKTLSLPGASDPGFRGGYKNPKFKRKEYKEKFGTAKGVISAGLSSPLNAGAATCMLMSQEALDSHDVKPMVKLISMGWAGVDPSVMGRGPVPASEMALKHAGLSADDIDYWEINEAFTVVALNCMHHFNIPEEKVNVKGGATAIGHPLGASGIRLPSTLARILNEKKAKYGLANLCCGSGQGVAVIMENPNI